MTSRVLKIAAPLAASFLFAGAAMAADAPAGGPPPGPMDGPPVMAMALAPSKDFTRLTVTSTAFDHNTMISNHYTQYGDNKSPPLSWSAGPAGTITYAVLLEDTGGMRKDPVFHWVLYDLPASKTSLPEGIENTAKTPDGASQGLNARKMTGFMGPRPPAPQIHPYHFEVFALDTKLGLDPATADRNAVVAAMKGHVLASGEVVAMSTEKLPAGAK